MRFSEFFAITNSIRRQEENEILDTHCYNTPLQHLLVVSKKSSFAHKSDSDESEKL